jgi:hypothetical protein
MQRESLRNQRGTSVWILGSRLGPSASAPTNLLSIEQSLLREQALQFGEDTRAPNVFDHPFGVMERRQDAMAGIGTRKT